MPLYWKRKALLAKSEVTYGTDPVPTAGANAILARNVKISPLEQNYDDLNRDLHYVGNMGSIVAGSYVKIDFEVEIAGGGAAGTAPGYGPLLKACAMSETISAATSVTYAPVNPSAETSVTIYWYMGGRMHKATGALGNVSFELSRGRVPLMKYSFLGLYTIPSDTALITPTLTAFQKPLAVNNTNTTPVTLHSYSGKFSELSLATGNEINYRNLIGTESIRLTDRKSTGKVKLEDELVATKDWWTIIKAGTLGTLACTHGTAAGNKVQITGSNVQLTNPSIDQDQNIAMLGLDLHFTPSSAGNDEWAVVIT